MGRLPDKVINDYEKLTFPLALYADHSGLSFKFADLESKRVLLQQKQQLILSTFFSMGLVCIKLLPTILIMLFVGRQVF